MVACLFAAALVQAASLSTTYANNNSQNGIMFDLVANQSLTITGIAVNLQAGSHSLQIYGRTGTWVGFDASNAGWTLLGSPTATSAGTGVATTIPIALNISLTTGQRYALYVTTTDESTVFYTNGTGVGNIAATDGFLQILEGVGKAYPFSTTFTPRIPNVTIVYSPGASVPTLSEWALILLAIALAGLGAIVLARRAKLGRQPV
jgi:hypothetical protein